MTAADEEPGVLAKVKQAIAAWVPVLRRFVLGPGGVDPTGVEASRPAWVDQVDNTILPVLDTVVDHAWRWQSGEPFVSQNSFVQAQLALTRNLLVRMPDDIYNAIFYEISTGTAAGESREQIAQRIDHLLLTSGSEWWENRAKVIARTETNRAWNAGQLAAAQYYEPPTGPGWVKVWKTDMDGSERAAHRRANGQTRSLTDSFQVGGEDLRFPGDPAGRPDNVINCVSGDTHIVAPGIRAAYRYWHNGTALSILTAQGHILTASPNHPVLTVQGWVTASQLVKGDHLIGSFGTDALAGLEPDVQAQPVTAAQVFDALDLAWPGKWVSGLDVNFHGDRPEGDVKVVLPDRELNFGVESTLAKQVNEFLFACAGQPTTRGCPSFEPPIILPDTPDSLVGFGDLIRSPVRAHLGPLDGLSLAASAQGQASFGEPQGDHGTADAHVITDGLHGLSALVSLDQVVDIKIDAAHSGYLYTFETASGAYVSNAIVSHNCRCEMTIRKGV